MDYYKIAEKAYCMEGDQWNCRDCDLIKYFELHNCDAAACRQHLIIKLVKQYKKFLEKQRND